MLVWEPLDPQRTQQQMKCWYGNHWVHNQHNNKWNVGMGTIGSTTNTTKNEMLVWEPLDPQRTQHKMECCEFIRAFKQGENEKHNCNAMLGCVCITFWNSISWLHVISDQRNEFNKGMRDTRRWGSRFDARIDVLFVYAQPPFKLTNTMCWIAIAQKR